MKVMAESQTKVEESYITDNLLNSASDSKLNSFLDKS